MNPEPNRMTTTSCFLKELIDRQSHEIKSTSDAKIPKLVIPALQRGLVWKPQQIECLWDSLGKFFPIGSFICIKADESQQQHTKSLTDEQTHYLIDGQQRLNAMLFATKPINWESEILWYDIIQKQFRLTTPTHPWGFPPEGGMYNISHIRLATSKGINKSNPLPYLPDSLGSSFPVPLPTLYGNNDPVSSYQEYTGLKLPDSGIKSPSEYKTEYEEAFNFIHEIKCHYPITIITVPSDTSPVKQRDNNNEQSSLETMFNRINTQGTKISLRELFYSAILARWSELKTANEEAATGLMPADSFIQIAIRFAIYQSDKKDQTNKSPAFRQKDISLQEIRMISYSFDDDEKKKSILSLYRPTAHETEPSIIQLSKKIKNWLTYTNHDDPGLPPAILNTISTSSPHIFLLLLWLADKQQTGTATKNDEIPHVGTRQTLIGLVLYLHWGKAKDTVTTINRIIQECEQKQGIESIKKALYEGMIAQELLPPPSSCVCIQSTYEEYANRCEDSHNNLETGKHEKHWQSNPWYAFFEKMTHNRNTISEVLLYLQRAYLLKQVGSADPAVAALWQSHNRPWDIDHIVPKSWPRYKRTHTKHFLDQWIHRLGNLQVLSLDDNRRKGDSYIAGDECFCQLSLRYIDRYVKDLTEAGIKNSNTLCNNAPIFAKSACEREKHLWQMLYDTLNWNILFGDQLGTASSDSLPNCISTLLSMKSAFQSHSTKWAIIRTHTEEIISPHGVVDLCHSWITLSLTNNTKEYTQDWHKCRLCITTNGDNTWEIGFRHTPKITLDKEQKEELRKKIEASNIDLKFWESDNEWWYWCRNDCNVERDPTEAQNVIRTLLPLTISPSHN